MGLILLGIQNSKQKLDYCFNVASRIDTYKLRNGLDSFLYRCFRLLTPLTYGLKYVGKDEDYEVLIGEWIRRRRRGDRLGSPVQKRSLFNVITKFGEQMKPLVRKAVAEEFSALVDLTRQLIRYDSLEFWVGTPPIVVHRFDPFDDNKIEPVEIDSVGLQTDAPEYVALHKVSGSSIKVRLKEPESFLTLEDLTSYMVRLYSVADSKVSALKEHNYRIMKEMERVIAPFAIAEEVHG